MMTRLGKPYQRNSGFSYLEIIMGVVILGVVLIPLLSQFYVGFLGNRTADAVSRAVCLAVDLMEEIKSRRFDENQFPEPATSRQQFGPDTGEHPQDRRTFDDVDDYHGWTSSPPRAIDGSVLNEFSEFTRSVQVEYVTIGLENSWQTTSSTTHYKRVTVSVFSEQSGSVAVETLFAFRSET